MFLARVEYVCLQPPAVLLISDKQHSCQKKKRATGQAKVINLH